MTKKRLTANRAIFILILINFVLGIFIVPDFGRSIDENLELSHGAAALKAYAVGSFGSYNNNEINKFDRFYGTAMTMVAQWAEEVYQPILDLEPGIAAHYTYFVMFQISIVSLYFLTKKFVAQWIAFGAALLFTTQPLLFGHAFINPKDIPLLSFFLATVTAGIYMSDHLTTKISQGQEKLIPISSFNIVAAWRDTSAEHRKRILLLQLIWPSIFALFLISNNLLPGLVDSMFQARPGTFLAGLLTRLVQNPLSADISAYINKAIQINLRLFKAVTILAFFVIGFVLIRCISGLWQFISSQWIIPLIYEFRLRRIVSYLTDWRIIVAAFLWGVTISTRVLGIFAGMMVGLYLLLRVGKRGFSPLSVYLLITLGATYISWPELWTSGLSTIIKALRVFSSFFWNAEILYQGEIFRAEHLPPSYMPFFLSTQFTMPVLLLAVTGMSIALFKAISKKENWQLVLITASWFILPIIFVLLTHPKLYNNCRQFLFISPPLFVFAGIGLQEIFRRINSNIMIGVVSVVVLVPGILAIFQLHPYEYIYYNQFVGGVNGAFRRYELDYWDTSATQSIKYLNQIAPTNSKVLVWGFPENVEFSAREDLEIIYQRNSGEDLSQYDYAIINTNFNADLLNLTDKQTIHLIERNGAILSVVRILLQDP